MEVKKKKKDLRLRIWGPRSNLGSPTTFVWLWWRLTWLNLSFFIFKMGSCTICPPAFFASLKTQVCDVLWKCWCTVFRFSKCAFCFDSFFFFLVSNLALVKPEKTKAVENYLIQMARYGQLSGKVSLDMALRPFYLLLLTLSKHLFKRSVSFSRYRSSCWLFQWSNL